MTDENRLNRRQLLKFTGAGLAAGALSSGVASAASTERYGIQFERVVDAVDDLGMDPNGNRAIDGALARTMRQGDTLVEFPPGEYLIRDEIRVGGPQNWGMRGLGDDPEDVRFVSNSREGLQAINTWNGNGVLVENVALDYSQRRRGKLGLRVVVYDNLRIQDVHFVGFNPTESNGAVVTLSPVILDPGGEGVVEGVERTGGTEIKPHRSKTSDPNAPGIIWTGTRHRGRLYVRNSRFENAGENGIYASAPSGDVRIEDCTFVNNNQAAVRIGGDGSYVKDSEFIVDSDAADRVNSTPLINPNMIIWETDQRGESGGSVEGCTFTYESVPKPVTALWVDGSAGSMTVRDCQFEMNADGVRPIRVDDPVRQARLGKTAERPWGVTIEGVTITGDSSGSAAIELFRRPDSTVRDSCIQMTGGRDGVSVSDSSGCEVVNTNINVDGRPTTTDNATLSTSDLRLDGSCPLSGAASSDDSGEGSDDSDSDESDSDDSSGGSDDSNSDESDSDDSGGGTDDSYSGGVRELVVHGAGDGRYDYRIRYDGTASTDERGDSAGGGVIEGSLWRWNTDTFELEGEVTEIVELTDGATVTLDGERIDDA